MSALDTRLRRESAALATKGTKMLRIFEGGGANVAAA